MKDKQNFLQQNKKAQICGDSLKLTTQTHVRGKELLPFCFYLYNKPATAHYNCKPTLRCHTTQGGSNVYSASNTIPTTISTTLHHFEQCFPTFLLQRYAKNNSSYLKEPLSTEMFTGQKKLIVGSLSVTTGKATL